MSRESDREAASEALVAALGKVRGAWADLDTSRRDWGFSGNADAGCDRASTTLHMLMTEQAEEARRLYLAASDAAEALVVLGFRH